ncbi:hypothetical protein PsYK624_118760 [Phanerochaete sordida]|uniref:Uncharacterized protein n=1 Tax=Phanerochaete sordida TaxID=48140 RepID=A0A9P3GIG4_9APHY|nr:hypothetical protein PsYK624_118760 [Phanerochaete sordida]
METRSRAGRQKPSRTAETAPQAKRPAAAHKKKGRAASTTTLVPIVAPNVYAVLSNHGDRLPPETPELKPEVTPKVARAEQPPQYGDSVSQFGDDESELSYVEVEDGECPSDSAPASTTPRDTSPTHSEGDANSAGTLEEDQAAEDLSESPPSPPPPPTRRTLGQSIAEARRTLRGTRQGAPVDQLAQLIDAHGSNKENAHKPNLTLRGRDPAVPRAPARPAHGLSALTPTNRQDYQSLLLAPAAAIPAPPIEFLPPLVTPPSLPPPKTPEAPRAAAPPKKLTQAELRRARLPAGAPILPSRPQGKRPEAPVDRSPHGKAVQRDSEAPHKKPRLNGAGPVFIGSGPFVVTAGTQSSQATEDTEHNPLHVLADAALGSGVPGSSQADAPGRPGLAQDVPPMASLRDDEPSRSLTSPDGGHYSAGPSQDGRASEDQSIPTVAQGSLEAFITSDTSTIGASTSEPATTFTPTPPSGFPEQNGGSPGWQMTNQAKENIIGWVGLPGGKVLAVAFGQGANDHKLDDRLFSTVAHVQNVTMKFLGVSTVHVSPPIAERQVKELNQAPYAYLVHGFSAGRATQLIRQKCLSTPKVTVMFFPFAVTLPSLFVTFAHITDCGCDMVRNMAIATMTRGPNLVAIVELLRETPGLPDTMDFVELARRLINTVRITRSEKHGRGASLIPIYSLYMSTSIMTTETWKLWHRLLNSFQWADIFLAEVAVRSNVECEGCHGRDHYQFSCPFMQIPGWHGVMPPPKRRIAATTTTGPRPQAPAAKEQGPPPAPGTHRPPRNTKNTARVGSNK